MFLMIFLLMALNFLISWFNAWACGKAWVETKAVGGVAHFMNWMGAIMSACGFTWVYLIILALIAGAAGWLDDRYVEAMLSLGYLVIIGPILGSGLAITLDSWAYFWRKKSLGSGAVAGWNTFAQAYNTYQAVSAIPEALGSVFDAFGGKGSRSKSDGKSAMAMIAILLVVLALVGGVLTTSAIIRATARKHACHVALEHG